MHRLVLFGFVWLLSCALASGEVLTKGLSVDAAIGAMKAAGYVIAQQTVGILYC